MCTHESMSARICSHRAYHFDTSALSCTSFKCSRFCVCSPCYAITHLIQPESALKKLKRPGGRPSPVASDSTLRTAFVLRPRQQFQKFRLCVPSIRFLPTERLGTQPLQRRGAHLIRKGDGDKNEIHKNKCKRYSDC